MASGFRLLGCADYVEAWQQGLDRFFNLAADLGFSIANICYPMSLAENADHNDLQAVYGAASVDRVVSFSAHEKALLFDTLAQVIKAKRHRLRIFALLCSLHALKAQLACDAQGYACRGRIDFFFVDAVQGHAFPLKKQEGDRAARPATKSSSSMEGLLVCDG